MIKVHFPYNYNSRRDNVFSRPVSCRTTYFRESSKTSIEEALKNRIKECEKRWAKKEQHTQRTNNITPLINRPLMSKEEWLKQKNNKHVKSYRK